MDKAQVQKSSSKPHGKQNSRTNKTRASKNNHFDRANNSVSFLQQSLGNQAVGRMIQAKLTIGEPDDKYEREADQMADKVMRMPESASNEDEETTVQVKPIANQITSLVQREPEEQMDEDELTVQAMSNGAPIQDEEETIATKPLFQRQTEPGMDEEEESVQTKPYIQRQANEEDEEPLQEKSIVHQMPPLVQRASEEQMGYDESTVQTLSDGAPIQDEEETIATKPLLQRQTESGMVEEEAVQTKPYIQREEAGKEKESVQMKPISGSSPQVSKINHTPTHSVSPFIQRVCTDCEEDVQRQPEEEDELAQRKPLGNQQNISKKTLIQPKGVREHTPQFNATTAANIHSLKGGGTPLPKTTRRFFEPRFGSDFSQVRVHTGSNAAEISQDINARAFTMGKNIAFGKNQYSPESSSGRRLLAHELTHVVQQNSNIGAIQSLQREVSGDTGKGGAIGATAPVEMELKGVSNFNGSLPPANTEWIDQQPTQRGLVKVKYGKLARGTIEVRKKTKHYAVRRAAMPLAHPLFRQLSATPELTPHIIIQPNNKGLIKGFVGLGANKKSPNLANQIKKAPELFGLAGFEIKRLPLKNMFENGQLAMGVEGVGFHVGGAFSGTFNLNVLNEKITFDGNATISAQGLADGTMKLTRTETGLINGTGTVAVNLPSNITGKVKVDWDGENITGDGTVGYEGEKLSGKVHMVLMEKGQALQLEKEKKAPTPSEEQPAGSPAAKKKSKKSKKIDFVVFGDGNLDFAFNEWLNGNAQVIIDPKGFLTVIGEITPQAEFELFPQKDYSKDLFKLEARAIYGVPVVGNIFIFANIGMDAFAKVGPGRFYNIVVDGTYSTDPEKSNDFSIQGSFNISAAAGLRLRGEAGAGLEVLDHDIKAGAGINAIAAIRGYAEATPIIGYREKGNPGEDKKGEFFIRGELEIAAQPFLGLSGDLFVELDSPWWSPAPDKTWTWPLGGKEWPIGGEFGIGASVDYVFGSGEAPAVEFKPVDFSADKFLTDLYSDKAQASGKSGVEQAGKWKEKNQKAAAPPEGSKKGDGQEGKAEAQPQVQSANKLGGVNTKKKANPNDRTAEGKSVKEYQDEAAKKGKKPEAKEPTKGADKEESSSKAKEKPTDEGKDESQKWQRGVTVVKQALSYAKREGIDLNELNRVLKSIKKRKGFGFSKLYVEPAEQNWLVLGSMSPDGKPVTKIKKKDDSQLLPTQVKHETDGNRAGFVAAKPLTKKAGNTKGYEPRANIPGWAHAQALNKQKDEWVRLHLLNENLHGPGMAWNLTPGTKVINSAMERNPERDAKAEIKNNMTLFYETTVSYHDSDPKFHDKKNYPKSIIVNWGKLEADGKKTSGSDKTWSSGQIDPPPQQTGVVTVNINTDGQTNLQSFLKISEHLARKIVEERVENGPFAITDFEQRMKKRTPRSFDVQWPDMANAMLDSNIDIVGFTDQDKI